MGTWVLRTACAQLAAWDERLGATSPSRIFVNVSVRELGCDVAIDDFGVGYSTLSRLVRIPAAVLKVDQSFARDLLRNSEAKAVVSAVLLLGDSLDRTVVVEGVEDAATLVALKELGVTYAQGFHLGMPMPAEELDVLLT
jgi:EAL domain-containing protein (putative c-di-GMP-specific phosphodiesterase class I)